MLPEGQTHGTILQPYDTKVHPDDQAHGPYHHTLACITFLNCINLKKKLFRSFPLQLVPNRINVLFFLKFSFLFLVPLSFNFCLVAEKKWLKLGVFEASNLGRYDFLPANIKIICVVRYLPLPNRPYITSQVSIKEISSWKASWPRTHTQSKYSAVSLKYKTSY